MGSDKNIIIIRQWSPDKSEHQSHPLAGAERWWFFFIVAVHYPSTFKLFQKVVLNIFWLPSTVDMNLQFEIFNKIYDIHRGRASCEFWHLLLCALLVYARSVRVSAYANLCNVFVGFSHLQLYTNVILGHHTTLHIIIIRITINEFSMLWRSFENQSSGRKKIEQHKCRTSLITSTKCWESFLLSWTKQTHCRNHMQNFQFFAMCQGFWWADGLLYIYTHSIVRIFFEDDFQ